MCFYRPQKAFQKPSHRGCLFPAVLPGTKHSRQPRKRTALPCNSLLNECTTEGDLTILEFFNSSGKCHGGSLWQPTKATTDFRLGQCILRERKSLVVTGYLRILGSGNREVCSTYRMCINVSVQRRRSLLDCQLRGG